MKKLSILGIGLATMITLVGCGSESASTDEQATSTEKYPLTISNYTKAEGATTYTAKDQVFDQAPKRVVPTTRTVAEMMLHLDLGDKIVGVGGSFGTIDESVATEYDKLNILSEEYIGKEVALGQDPDLIIGRGGLFDAAEWGVGTIDELNDLGINTYAIETSVPGGVYESTYTDIENLGDIFDVEEKADAFIDELKDKQEEMEESLSSIEEEKTFAYIHSTDPNEILVYAAHDETFFNDIFSMIKMKNIFAEETGDVSVETLIATDPDVIITLGFEGSDPEVMKQGLLSNPKLSSMKAIQNKQIYTVDYNYLFGYDFTAIEGMEMLAKEMYPDLFK